MKTATDWLKRFYPREANGSEGSWAYAINHSIKKWSGLYSHILVKYGLRTPPEYRSVFESGGKIVLEMGSESCQLCKKSVEMVEDYIYFCQVCPLYLSRDNKTCWDGKESPWNIWTQSGNPKPMILALELARDWEKKNKFDEIDKTWSTR